jgi:hypothetical protein
MRGAASRTGAPVIAPAAASPVADLLPPVFINLLFLVASSEVVTLVEAVSNAISWLQLFEDIEQQLSVSEKDERDERGIILTDLLE